MDFIKAIDELKEYYDNKCVRICKYYEVCTRVDKLLKGE